MVARKDGLPAEHHPPEVWAAIRTAYTTTSATAAILEKRTGVKEHTIRARASREGWTKQAAWAQAEAAHREAQAPAPPSPALEAAADGDGLEIAKLTLSRAVYALAAGRAAEAQGIVTAGVAVGEFSDVIAALRAAREAGDGHADSRGLGEV